MSPSQERLIENFYLTVKPSRIEKIGHERLGHLIQRCQHDPVDNAVHSRPFGWKDVLAFAGQCSQHSEKQ